MANVTWKNDADGDWDNAANWSNGALPGSSDDVTIATPNIRTITHSTGNDFVNRLTVTNDQFELTGGNLTIVTAATFTDSFDQTGGNLLGAAKITILDGASLLGGYAGGAVVFTIRGTIALANYTLGGSASLTNVATTNETGQVAVGDVTGIGARITNQAKANYEIGGDFGVSAGSASAAFVNAGNLVKAAGSGVSVIAITLNSTGTLSAATGTLELDSAGDTIGGALTGAGQIAFAGGYAYALAAGTTATAAQIDLYGAGTVLTLGGALSYAGLLNATGGTALALGGNTLTLSGNAALAATIEGGGTLVTSGKASVGGMAIVDGANWTDSGSVAETGPVQIGDSLTASTLTIAAGGTYTLGSNDGIVSGGDAAASLVNAGTIIKTYAGTSAIAIATTSTGTIDAGAGTAINFDAAGDMIGGKLIGAGQIDIYGSATLAAGTVIAAGGFGVLGGGEATLAGNLSYTSPTGEFQLNGSGVSLNLNGHTLTTTNFYGQYQNYSNPSVVGGGAIDVSGDAHIEGLTLGGGVILNNAGVADQSSNDLQLDDAGTTVNNLAGANWNFNGDTDIASNAAVTTAFVNAGTLSKIAGTGTSAITPNVTSTGVIDIMSGAIELAGQINAISGTVTGAGAIDFGGGVTTIASGTIVTAAGVSIFNNGVSLTLNGSLTYGGNFSQGYGSSVYLDGHTLTLNGSNSFYYANYAVPTITGTGALVTSGQTAINQFTLGGSVTWNNSGVITLTGGPLAIGDGGTSAATLNNQAGASLLFANDNASISRGAVLANAIVNAGLISKTGGTGTSAVAADVTSTGVISVASGTLAFDGAKNTIGGTLSGAGQIEFSGGATTLSAGLSATVANIAMTNDGTSLTLASNFTYTGGYYQDSGSAIDLAGHTLTFVGSVTMESANYEGPTIDGGGALDTGGMTSIGDFTLGGGVTWTNSGTITLSGSLAIGDSGGKSATLVNKAGASFLILTASNPPVISSGVAVGSDIANAGTFGKTGGGGTSRVAIAIANTGVIEAYDGTLDLQDGVSGGGRIKIDNGAALELDGAVGAQSISFGSGGGTVILTDEAAFAGGVSSFGTGGAIDLSGFGYNSTTETKMVSGGVLTVTDGSQVAKILLFGQFAAAGFQLNTDDGGGTLITYAPTPAAHPLDLAAAHH
jgi:hypothetical protein